MWDHTMLFATRHKRTHPASTPASKAGTRFTYPRGMEGWVDLDDLLMPWPGVKPATAWSKIWRPNRCFTKTPSVTLANGYECRYAICPAKSSPPSHDSNPKYPATWSPTTANKSDRKAEKDSQEVEHLRSESEKTGHELPTASYYHTHRHRHHVSIHQLSMLQHNYLWSENYSHCYFLSHSNNRLNIEKWSITQVARSTAGAQTLKTL